LSRDGWGDSVFVESSSAHHGFPRLEGGRQTDVPSLREDNAQDEEQKNESGGGPAVCGKGYGLVEVLLIYLCRGAKSQHCHLSADTRAQKRDTTLAKIS